MKRKGIKQNGEVWHLYMILKTIKIKPQTQMEICKKSKIANHDLKVYLKRLKKLGYVSQESIDGFWVWDKKPNSQAKLWLSTPSGRSLMNILEGYAKLKDVKLIGK